MTRWLVVTAALVAFPAMVSAQGSPLDEAQIRAQIQGYVDAFNRGDADALASYVDVNGTRINASGRILDGKSAIQSHYLEVFSNPPPRGVRRHLSYDDVTVRFITNDVAVVDARYEASGVGPDPTLVGRGRNTVVMVKRDGKWLRAAHRNHLSITTECYKHCTGQ